MTDRLAPLSVSRFSVLTFDCYGTLIDWEAGIWDALQPLLHGTHRPAITRARALSIFGKLESEQEAATPARVYEGILEAVHQRLAAELGLRTTPEMDRVFAASIGHWPAFADTAEALRQLAQRYKLVILSNVSKRGIAASNRKLGVTFDATYTAEDIGSYKPSPANFTYLLSKLREDLGVERQQILHVAQSLFHDHVPARAAGLATAWIDRQRLSKGGSWGATAQVEEPPETDFLFYTLAELAAAAEGDAASGSP